jgi:hypothetical protein
MKNSIFILIIMSFFSCSSDDTSTDTSNNNNLPVTTYINLSTNNFWKYRIETKNGTEPTIVEPNLDHLKIGTDEVIAGNTFKKMEAEGAASGFFTGTMDQKKLRKVSDRLEFTGNISLELGNDLPTQSIPVENFIIFKESAVNNVLLKEISGTLPSIPITIPLNGIDQNIQVTVKYKFRSIAGETLNSFTASLPNSGTPDITYTNVKAVKYILTIEAKAPLLGIEVNLLSPVSQDFIVSTSYYAKNKGVVHTQTNTNLSFLSTLNFSPISILQKEYLEDFLNN